MGDIKYSKSADGVGYLYRAALYLAKGEREAAVTFLQKAVAQKDTENSKELKSLLKELTEEKSTTLIAEKILDQYKKLSFLLH